MKKTVLFVSAVAMLTGAVAVAQSTPGTTPAPINLPSSAPAGVYNLDPAHAAVNIRIAHNSGISYSSFRFEKTSGTLNWDGANPEKSSVSVNIDPKSIMAVVPGFGSELQGERWLNSAKYPEASFVSTGIRKTGPKTGVITGNLTFMGVTRPLDVTTEMVGAGKDFRGNSVVGFSGTASFNRSDFGMRTMVGPVGNTVMLQLDLEFIKPKA